MGSPPKTKTRKDKLCNAIQQLMIHSDSATLAQALELLKSEECHIPEYGKDLNLSELMYLIVEEMPKILDNPHAAEELRRFGNEEIKRTQSHKPTPDTPIVKQTPPKTRS